MEAAAITATNLIKRYGNRTVLDGITFSVAATERIALMGPSGSGKSTLLNCLGGIDRPDSGELLVAGQDLASLDGEALAALRRRDISTIFQFFHLLPTLSARENIEFPLQLAGVAHAERQERVSELLEDVQVAHRADAPPAELSGGEMQRIAIARALAHRPRILLADEPTGNLDRKTGETILDLLERLTDAHNIALVLVTHSQTATRICQRTLTLEDGRIISDQ